jgi:hypothetical protein
VVDLGNAVGHLQEWLKVNGPSLHQ